MPLYPTFSICDGTSKFLAGVVVVLCNYGSSMGSSVVSWIPAYEVQEAASILQKGFAGGLSPAQTLSRLAFQFWVPVEGALMLDKRVREADVRELVSLAKRNDLEVLLCIANAYTDAEGEGFSWDRAKAAFADKREAFVEQILAEVEKYGMNGVEIDLESERDGLTSEDRSAYAAFVTALAKELHSRGKILTISSLAGRWFGPNNTWWQDWAKVVDGIQSMGYSEIGKAGTQDWDSYQAQVSLWIKAGGDPKKFANGVSVYFKQWKGGSVEENLAALYDVAQATGSGVAVWDLSCSAHPEAVDPGWSTGANWDWIRKIREVTGSGKVDTTRSARAP